LRQLFGAIASTNPRSTRLQTLFRGTSTSRTKPFGLKCYMNATHTRMMPCSSYARKCPRTAEITQTVTKSERPHEMRARFGVPNPLRTQVSSTPSAGRIHVRHSNLRYQTRRSFVAMRRAIRGA
jgi:hypothetical protein